MIVDSPAMLPVGDASAIARSVDGLVFLVDMHLVKRPQLAQAADQLRRLPCRLLGTVVRSDEHGGGRYGYYGSQYTLQLRRRRRREGQEEGRPPQPHAAGVEPAGTPTRPPLPGRSDAAPGRRPRLPPVSRDVPGTPEEDAA